MRKGLVSFVKRSDITKIYWFPRAFLISSPKTSMETDSKGASARKSWNSDKFVGGLMRLWAQVEHSRTVE